MGSGKITISDVAREAGVSIATVSRVMQGRTTVAPDLAQRVQEVARRFGYRPSPMARGLATGSSGMVGIMVPQLSNPYFQELVRAIAVGLGEEGFRMLILESDDRAADEPDLAASLYAHADAVILCSPRMPDEELAQLAVGRPRLLCVNRIPADGVIPSLACDSYQPMSEVCRLLAGLGHRRVVYLSGVPASWINAMRWRAVKDSAVLGMEPFRVPAGATIDDGYEAVDAALGLGPTALIACNDLCAVGALTRLRELGLRVPADISLNGFDDIPFSQHTWPALTTVRIPRSELADRLWAMMRSVLAGEVPPNEVLTSFELLVRGTTGPASAGSRAAAGPAFPA